MKRQDKSENPGSARNRILDASVRLFSERSYDTTSLRDIAAAANVDVAYVHRTYGSKAEIFRLSLLATRSLDLTFEGDAGTLLTRLAEKIIDGDSALGDSINPLDIFIRSISCVDAQPILRDYFHEHVTRRLSEKLEQDDAIAAAMTGAFVAGFAILRHVIRSEPLASADRDALVPKVTRVFEQIIGIRD